MNSKYVLLGGLYFVQGMPYGLQSGLLPIYLRSVGLSFSKISLAKMLYLPWILKMLWAPLVDQYHTKQTWLVLSMSGLVLACLACATMSPETNFLPVAAMLLLMNFFASVQDIAVDGVAIGLLWQDEIGYGNTIQVVAYKLGSVLAGGGLLTLMHLLGWGVLFLLLAIIYLLAILYVWSAPELWLTLGRPSQDGQPRTRTFNPWRILQELLRVPGTLWTTGFVFLYKLGEQGTTTMFPLFLLDHGFSTQQLGFWNGVVAMVFSITGSSLGGQLMSKQSLRACPGSMTNHQDQRTVDHSPLDTGQPSESARMEFLWHLLMVIGILEGTGVSQECTAQPGAWNLALRCPATQSSTLKEYGPVKAGAGNAVDGKCDGILDHDSCTHTEQETEPWWNVDLDSRHSVSTVIVKNREDCCGERIKGAQIHVGDSKAGHGKDDPMCGTVTDTRLGSVSTIACNGLKGRYVTIIIPGRRGILTLCEVEVIAQGCPLSPVGKELAQCEWKLIPFYVLPHSLLPQPLPSETAETLGHSSLPTADLGRGSSWQGQMGEVPSEHLAPSLPWGDQLQLGMGRGGAERLTQNLALGRLATQSSTLKEYGSVKAGAGNAVDGKRDGILDHDSCTHTEQETEPWWNVDLDSRHSVSTVIVKNREDCCGERIKGAQIHVGDSKAGHGKDDPICGTITDTTPGSLSTICCNGMEGRYVTITIPDREEYLTLCEVEVYGTPVGDC
ncbi:unnamed protein product [Natator depressus]